MNKLSTAPAFPSRAQSSRPLVVAVAAATCLAGAFTYLALDDAQQSTALQVQVVNIAASPANRGWGDTPSGPGATPFGALACGPSGGLLESSSACNPDPPSTTDKEEISSLALLRNGLAALSASDIEPIYQINRALAECAVANGVASAEPSKAKNCDATGVREVVAGIEAALSTFHNTPKGREAMLSWLVHWEQLEHKTGAQGKGALDRFIPETDASADGKQLRNRLRAYLEKLETRDAYAQSVLDRLKDEDALAIEPVVPERAES